MRTVSEIKHKIQLIQESSPSPGTTRSEKLKYNKVVEEVKFLYGVQLYLESNPKEEFIRSEVTRLQDKLQRIEDAYPTWKVNTRPPVKNDDDEKNYRKSYDKEMEVDEINKRIKHLKFILQ